MGVPQITRPDFKFRKKVVIMAINVGDTFSELKMFLKEMFQFNENDLDFGIFKVIRLKRQFIEKFIDGDGPDDLRAVVTNELSGLQNADLESARSWLSNFAGQFGERGAKAWKAMAFNPHDKASKAKFESLLVLVDDEEKAKAEQQIKLLTETSSLSSAHLEAKVYNYLLNFFELYYQNGDFGYNTRASTSFKVPYEVDYDGADILFHWKHKDSYYIKTGNGFHSVKFDLLGETIEFRVEAGGEADDTPQNNNKEGTFKHYRLARIEKQDGVWQIIFNLSKKSTSKSKIYPKIWRTVFRRNEDLSHYLLKKDGAKPIFKDLDGDYEKTDSGQLKGISHLRLNADKYYKELAKKSEFKDLGRNADKRAKVLQEDETAGSLFRIDQNLNKFYVGMDADYFIHKDLRGFLNIEKDRFIKNVIFSDLYALLHASRDNTTMLIARAFSNVADRIIDFLDAIETFQKNLFTLKKKVIGTHWLISVGKIPESFFSRLIGNQDQLAEWQSVYGVEVKTSDDIKAHPTLVVDTSLFDTSDPDFTAELLSDPAFDDLDAQTDGLLIHSENWQVLNLLQEKYRGQIKTVYIDPPYNTGSDGFLYKDAFRHSSWAAMMNDRLALTLPLFKPDGVLFASIDYQERDSLTQLLNQLFGNQNRVEELIWTQNTTKSQSPTYSTNHEYIEVYAKNLEVAKKDFGMFREPKPGYLEIMELMESLNLKYPSVKEIEKAIKDLMENHRKEFKEELQKMGLEYNTETKKLDPWKGIYNYRYAEYRNATGNLVAEQEAKKAAASIWVWREDNPSFPLGGGTANKPGVYDPSHPDFRFYAPLHPQTGRPCPHPKTGWRWPLKPIEGLANSFEDLVSEDRIVFGNDEKKIPQFKRFLHEVETNVAQSVFHDYTDGEKELTQLLGKSRSFPNPKPTTMIKKFVSQTTTAGDIVLDYFVGSGTTAQSVIALNKELDDKERRKFVITEMGKYVDEVTKPRLLRVMFSLNWKDGAPVNEYGYSGIIKVHQIEQYEDLLSNLESDWDGETLPKGVPVKYLFAPEQHRVVASLDLSKPFSQRLKVGRDQKETTIDLMETWCYLQGYWVKSRRVYQEDNRRYLVVETTNHRLIIFRDINDGEDDSVALKQIIMHYVKVHDGEPVTHLDVNHDVDLRKLPLPTTIVTNADFDRGTAWN